MTPEQFKNHFRTAEGLTHFNNAGQCLLPDVNRACALKWLDRLSYEGAACSVEGWAQIEVTRKSLAKFLGADHDEVAFFTTTASAVSQAAHGIRLQPGDEILTWDQEYPSNFYPWRKAAEDSGAKLIQVESENFQTPANKLLEKVTVKTKVIAISWVQYQTGAVTDLKMLSEKLHGKNIWLVADIIQGAGVRPFNFHDCGFDIVCGGGHKWLCSSFGAGYILIKKDRINELDILETGAWTYGTTETPKGFTNQPKASAARFEPGSKPMLELVAMNESLELLSEYGIENIFRDVCKLTDLLRAGLQKKGFKLFCAEGPIVNFAPENPADLKAVVQKLKAANVGAIIRGPGIRLSLHAYNRESEVERVLNLL